MKKIHASFFALILALVSGCIQPPKLVENMSVQEYSTLCTYTYDPYEKSNIVIGPQVAFDATGSNKYQLFAVWRESVVLYGMYVRTLRSYGDGWAFWEDVIDINGNKLATKSLFRDAHSGGLTTEKISTALPRAYLNQIAEKSMSFRVQGLRARIEFIIPSIEVKNFLLFVDSKIAIQHPDGLIDGNSVK